MEDLAAIFPDSNILQICGEPVDVSPLKLGELAKFMTFLKGLSLTIERLRVIYASKQAEYEAYLAGDVFDAEHETPIDPAALFALELLSGENLDKVLDGLALLTRQPRGFIDALELDDAVRVLAAVIAANLDMFQKKLLPAVTTNLTAITSRLGQAQPSA